MNIHFSSLFVNNENGNIIQQLNGEEIKEAIQSGKTADIKNLLPGQMFEGDIVEMDELQVKILLDNHSILNASMNEDMNLSIGEHVIFQVKENSDSKIVIRPFRNEEGNELVTRALNGSGVAVNSKNSSIVKELINQGQPLDKQTIMDTIRMVNKFPEAELSAIVELKKHDIPVTSDNLHMYQVYSEGNADMTADIKNLAENIPDILEHVFMEDESEGKSALPIFTEILDILMPDETADEKMPEAMLFMDVKGQETYLETERNAVNKLQSEMMEFGEKKNYTEISGTDGKQKIYSDYLQKIPTEIPIENKEKLMGENTGQEKKAALVGNPPEQETKAILVGNPSEQETKVALVGNPSEQKREVLNRKGEVVSYDSQGDLPQEKTKVSEKTILTVKNQLEQILNLQNREPDMVRLKQDVIKLFAQAKPEEREELVRNESFKKLIHKAVEKHFLLNPDEIKKAEYPKQEIEKLYERIKEQLNRLSQTVHDAIIKGNISEKSSAPLLNNMKNMAQNMNFMNELNHMASYIQIPVKFTNQENGAELYVYHNNSHKTTEEGIQAFLHFDLESLGATDIRIYLKKRGLRIGFELADKVSVELVKEHIEELVSCLEEKGYFVNCNVEQTAEKEYHPLEEIFQQDEKSVSIKRYSLDIRT